MTDKDQREGKPMPLLFAQRQPPQPEPSLEDIDDIDVEAEIGSLVRETHTPVRRLRDIPALPSALNYIQPQQGVSDSGNLSAQVMALEYEKSAQAMEAAAQELIGLAQRCDRDAMVVIEANEQTRAKIEAAIAECREAAAAYREEAKAIYGTIQNSSRLVDDVRRTMQEAVARIRARQTLPSPKPETDDDDDGAAAHPGGGNPGGIDPAG